MSVNLISVDKKGNILHPNELSNLIADITNSLFILACRSDDESETFKHKNGEVYILVHQSELTAQLTKLSKLKKMLSVETT